MPGLPVPFTHKTIILCHSLANTGKSTLGNFLANEKIVHFSTDYLHDLDLLSKINQTPNKFYNFLAEKQKSETLPLLDLVAKFAQHIDNVYHLEYCDYICQNIEKIFQTSPEVKIIMVEGYQMGLPNIKAEFLKRIKQKNYMCWNLSRI